MTWKTWNNYLKQIWKLVFLLKITPVLYMYTLEIWFKYINVDKTWFASETIRNVCFIQEQMRLILLVCLLLHDFLPIYLTTSHTGSRSSDLWNGTKLLFYHSIKWADDTKTGVGESLIGRRQRTTERHAVRWGMGVYRRGSECLGNRLVSCTILCILIINN